MDNRKRTKTEEQKLTELLIINMETQRALDGINLFRDMIPKDWHDMETVAPVSPVKEQITLRLDRDVIKWYRALGRGYQARINALLRSFMLARQTKWIEEAKDFDWKGQEI